MTSGTPGILYIVGAAKLLTHRSHSTEALQNAACKVPESGRAGGLPAPKVSVIVVNYNQGQYLSQAVDSVLRQTFKDLEIIIVDDGSRDNSIGIIHSMTGRDPERMRFCCHPNHQNLGISRTYALGIAEAKSMYVAFLEADDYWGRNYLERKVECWTVIRKSVSFFRNIGLCRPAGMAVIWRFGNGSSGCACRIISHSIIWET